MYKVFINHKTIILTQDISHLKIEDDTMLVLPDTKTTLVQEYQQFINNPAKTKLYIFKQNHIKELYHDFLSMFVKIEAAGGLVENAAGQFLFINRYGKWDLPKGKIEPFEKKDEAALREVEEETGIGELKIIQPLTKTRHIYEENGKHCLKITWWYDMKTSDNQLPVPQLEEGITKAEWIDRDKLNDVLLNTYHSIIDVIHSHFQLEEENLNNEHKS